jgi:UDP-GlcNAc:undecaprenyl-phosphate GlcNAc-1-phosphate transferase
MLLAVVFMGAVLGFLVYNFNPASIFMGDAGSLFIGFVLACLTVLGAPGRSTGAGPGPLLPVIAIPVLILFIPILDTGFVSFMRKLFRRPISLGGRDHSSHRMVAIGFSERRAVLVLYAFALASGFIALGMSYFPAPVMVVTLAFYLLFVIFFWIYLAKVKVYSGESIVSDRASGRITPLLVEITYRRRLFEVMLDFAIISIAYYTSYLLRFEGELGGNFDFFLKSVPIVIAAQLLSFYFFGMYRGIWESTSLRDLIGYLKAITVGTVLSILILLFVYRFYSFSRAVFVIYWGIMLILVSLSRLSFRLLDEGIRTPSREGAPALIYGAGTGGVITLKEIETDPDLNASVVGFIDDNPRIHRRLVRGYPVLGGCEDIERIAKRYRVKKVIVSFKDHGSDARRRVERLCLEHGLDDIEVRQMQITIS